MRSALDRIDGLGIRYFVTGSEAAACYGSLRQTFDMDVVIDLEPREFPRIATILAADHAIAEPVDFGDFWMASVVDSATVEKLDLIMRRRSPWSVSAMDRRALLVHPRHGPIWVASLEDLILAKLVWSEGTSELQLRDCGVLIRINGASIDWAYVDRWAPTLGVTTLLREVRDAS
jgi:hypothetical protein